ncbi:MAG: 2-C-methyl-D-erythritol 4-phosphate cytidylyltransferase [Acidobacteria bacterium]|nr:2-C-methyl-D-erythritol 4-phosphate cytidylyltransferase [Acidobacteriota bacterium]MBU4307471.1 2-C-methyl-D-erythritol 4-phosphate cytidylyltransferase [Acidobacteriota bacterium]MBU4404704.1 2-C-methyl-D-erythritol 4-phosphate cytidylyltransferase [Acidobacteriota bacterium]MCG2812895.1 2-C-methyl-D-erythritol 4-phosphate cytidylyltransferase [Candidatus Aminicenantes bacterium]
MSTIAIILAGGAGTRLQGPLPKQFRLIGGRSLLEICLGTFQGHPGLDGIIMVCPAAQMSLAEKTVAAGRFTKVINILPGGKTRQKSSSIGVSAAPNTSENILIHDAARALVVPAVISRVLEALAHSRAVMPVLPVSDTTIRVDDAGVVTAILDRAKLRRVQTPQGFKLEIIRQAHEKARAGGVTDASDDCSLVRRYDLAPVVTVMGDPANIKVTYPQDLAIAEAILRDA